MNVNLYAPRADIARIEYVGGHSSQAVYITAEGWSALVIVDDSSQQLLFDLFADASAHVANLYSSLVDGKVYTEWLAPALTKGFVISEGGHVLRTSELPKEEIPE